jgi:hypothetical protein
MAQIAVFKAGLPPRVDRLIDHFAKQFQFPDGVAHPVVLLAAEKRLPAERDGASADQQLTVVGLANPDRLINECVDDTFVITAVSIRDIAMRWIIIFDGLFGAIEKDKIWVASGSTCDGEPASFSLTHDGSNVEDVVAFEKEIMTRLVMGEYQTDNNIENLIRTRELLASITR